MAVTIPRNGVTRYDGPDVAKYLARFGLPAGGFAIDLGSAASIKFSRAPASHRKAPDVRPAPKAQVEPSLSLSAIYEARREASRHA